MQDTRPSPLNAGQTASVAVLALGLSVFGWWFGGITSPRPEQADTAPASVPINRREAETGTKNVSEQSTPDLAYYEETGAPPRRSGGIPAPMFGVSRQTNAGRSGNKSGKTIIIETNLLRGRHGMTEASGRPSGCKSSAGTAVSASATGHSEAAARSKASAKKSRQKKHTPAHKPAASPVQELSSAGLAYPPANIAAKIGLSSAWRSYSSGLTYIYDSSNTKAEGVRCQIAADLWASSASAASDASPAFQPFLNLDKLRLTLATAKTQQSPALAPAPPDKNDYLATTGPASNPQAYASAKVTGKLYGGMFSLICPINKGFGGSRLVNERGELTGIAVGTIPAYRGHNHFLGLDSSLIYAWSRNNKEAGLQRLYDLNFQVCDQLERALNRLDRKKAERQARKDEHSILPGKALGGFILGAQISEISAVLGDGSEPAQDLLGFELGAGDPMFKYVVYADKGLAFNYYDGRLAAIETTSPVYATPKGLKVGTSPNQGSHELTRRKCSGYTDNEHTLIAAQGLEIELNAAGIIELIRVTI